MRLNLPARPDLGHLKHQAKTLQQSVNAGNASLVVRIQEQLPDFRMGDRLKLGDAQLVIAREYGYPSWPKLKRAVAAILAGHDTDPVAATEDTVHITCGDMQSQTLNACAIPGLRLPWRDLYNMGPLPDTPDMETFCRARFEFLREWSRLPGMPEPRQAAREELGKLRNTLQAKRVIFWMWPLLTHQLTLLCLLDWYAAQDYSGEICRVDGDRFPRRFDAEAMLALYENPGPITPAQLTAAREAWAALRQPTPEGVLAFISQGPDDLPQLKPALQRYLAELPSTGNGLSGTAQAVLESLKAGPADRLQVFQSVKAQEAHPFMGDRGIWLMLEEMVSAPHPLVRTSDGNPFTVESAGDVVREQKFLLTALGEKVCAGLEDAIAWNGCGRWWGAVYLDTANHWRFDAQAMSLQHRVA